MQLFEWEYCECAILVWSGLDGSWCCCWIPSQFLAFCFQPDSRQALKEKQKNSQTQDHFTYVCMGEICNRHFWAVWFVAAVQAHASQKQHKAIKWSKKLSFIVLGVLQFNTQQSEHCCYKCFSSSNWTGKDLPHPPPLSLLLTDWRERCIDFLYNLILMQWTWTSAPPAHASFPGWWWPLCAEAVQHHPWSHPSLLVWTWMRMWGDRMKARSSPSIHDGT